MTSNQGSSTMRNVPDVAMVGDNIYVRYDNGSSGTFGGTSCAAPLWAAFAALVNQRALANGATTIGFINPAIYALGNDPIYAATFKDTATGNNFSANSPSQFSAVTGYDLCTGWGAPAGVALIDALAGAADSLQVTPATSFVSVGPAGGSFVPGSSSYTLTNHSAASLTWSAAAIQGWLTLSAPSGTLAAGASTTVTASLNAGANALTPGSYSDTVTFSNLATGVIQTRPVRLGVAVPTRILSVTPATTFTAAGFPGGPFTPSSATYSISNTGNAPMTWAVSKTSNWLTISPTTGSLAAGASVTVIAGFASPANSLPLGTYSDTFTFTNSSDGNGNTTRAVSLSVSTPPPPSITGTLGATGTLAKAFSYQITASNSPNSYGATGLPAGLSANVSTGLISGTPKQTGTFKVTVSATNAWGTGSATLTISVQTVVAWGYNGSGQTTIPANLSSVAAVAGGSAHCLALKSDGTVVGWGLNSDGQATAPTGLNTAVAVACGDSHSLALKANGTVVGWGVNVNGQSSIPFGLSNVVAIAAGFSHNLALKVDGTVVAWGADSSGDTIVPAGLNNVVAITAGSYHSLALRSDGTVVGWGLNNVGQATSPTGLSNVVAIAAGEYHNLALKSDGTVTAWGGNLSGQSTVPTGLNTVVAIACGSSSSLALKADGTVVAWGSNDSGQTTIPTGLSNVVGIGNTRGSFSLALTGNDSSTSPPVIISPAKKLGGMYPFQYRIVAKNSPTSYGATGLPAGLSVNTATGLISGTPTQNGTFNATISAINPWGTASASLVLTILPSQAPVIVSPGLANGTLGFSFTYQIAATNLPTSYGATGLPSALSVNTMTGLISGTLTQSGTSTVTITASNASGTASATLIIVPQTLVGWGSNSSGETTIPTAASNIRSIAAGSYNSLALKSDGTVIAWGSNDFNKGAVPSGLSSVAAITCGGTFSLALKLDGTVVGWGNNVYGQTTAPTGLNNVVAIAAGSLHSLALKADGTVVGWGNSVYGQATAPTGLNNVVAIACGDSHSVALKADGTVVAWGYNYSGQSAVPAGLSSVVAVAAGEDHSLALKSDGTVVAWGSNWAGQTSVPSGLSNVVGIAAGIVDSLALKADGTVVAWGAVNAGYQNYGQATVPAGLSAVVAIAAGYYHSLALIGNDSNTSPPVIISSSKKLGALYPFQYRIVAKNSPTSYGATGLPNGLSLNTSTGLISGTPTLGGTFNVTVSATNAWGTGSAPLALTVLPPPPAITSALIATGTTASAFSYQITATNSPTSYNATGLPPGLGVNTTTGVISGTPTTTGTNAVTLSATNTSGTGSTLMTIAIQTPYTAWQNQIFTPAELSNPAISGDLATPMGDGVSNLMKYALNLNPKIAMTNGLPLVSVASLADGDHVRLTYTRVLSATDITYIPEVSADLQKWNSGADFVAVVSVGNNPDGKTQTVVVQALAPTTGAVNRFIRLTVTKP